VIPAMEAHSASVRSDSSFPKYTFAAVLTPLQLRLKKIVFK